MKTIIIILLAFLLFACTNEENQELVELAEPTSGTFIDARDNREYKWIKIGNQTWMAENLAYLPSVTSSDAKSNDSPSYYVYGYYGNDVNEAKENPNYQKYGVLYDWDAALTACPEGWHIPDDEEWKQLEIELGMPEVAANEIISSASRGTVQGKLLKSNMGWYNNGNGTNQSGFSAIPGGYRFNSGNFCFIEKVGYYWTSSTYSKDYALGRGLGYNAGGISRNSNFKKNGFSVRCVKD